jgi:hypothetical protein
MNTPLAGYMEPAVHGEAAEYARPQRLRLSISMPIVFGTSAGLWYGIASLATWLVS